MSAAQRKPCASCQGFGDHGFENESGQPFICYACGGSGLAPSSPVFRVVIIDCEKAGLIGGPFKVVVTKDGLQIASTSGIQGPTGAAGVARNYASAYGVPDAEVLS